MIEMIMPDNQEVFLNGIELAKKHNSITVFNLLPQKSF